MMRSTGYRTVVFSVGCLVLAGCVLPSESTRGNSATSRSTAKEARLAIASSDQAVANCRAWAAKLGLPDTLRWASVLERGWGA